MFTQKADPSPSLLLDGDWPAGGREQQLDGAAGGKMGGPPPTQGGRPPPPPCVFSRASENTLQDCASVERLCVFETVCCSHECIIFVVHCLYMFFLIDVK